MSDSFAGPLCARICKSLALIVAGAALTLGAAPAAGQFDLSGFASVRGRAVDAQPSYREGGFGRFEGGLGLGEDDQVATARLSLVGQWRSQNGWLLRGTLQGQASTESVSEQDLSVAELFLAKRWERERFSTGFRLGHFFLPTSRENLESGWNSPYTMTFSAINSWLGEEVRPSGLELSTTLGSDTGFGSAVELGAGAFGGNDSSGALLAWRGWVLSDRVVGVGESVPLPDLQSLRDGEAFGEQRNDGTLPFGTDLDGQPGWYAFAIWRPSDAFSLRATHYDNRGDKELHRSGSGYEYAWSTDFGLLGADLRLGPVDFVAEWMDGHTGMGEITGVFVRADFQAYYLLASIKRGGWRATLRYDEFSTEDIDLASFDNNVGEGDAWTLAVFWEPGDGRSRFRVGAEWLEVDAIRPEALRSGLNPQNGGDQLQLELRVRIGS